MGVHSCENEEKGFRQKNGLNRGTVLGYNTGRERMVFKDRWSHISEVSYQGGLSSASFFFYQGGLLLGVPLY